MYLTQLLNGYESAPSEKTIRVFFLTSKTPKLVAAVEGFDFNFLKPSTKDSTLLHTPSHHLLPTGH